MQAMLAEETNRRKACQQDPYSTTLAFFLSFGLPHLTASQRRYNEDWSEHHKTHTEIVGKLNAEVALLDDSLIFGLSRYKKLWTGNFAPLNK